MTTPPAPLVEIHRGPIRESLHTGHAVICDASGQVVKAWGDPEAAILPRSSAKMVQALPLVASGAADAAGLGTRHLALACASHQGAAIHVDPVRAWLAGLGLDDDALRCGPQPSRDRALRHAMIRTGEPTCQVHNNCSGKHAGFLTLTRHLGAGPDYVEADHPVQRAVFDAFETVTDGPIQGHAIDGCSAPNPVTTLRGLARAMAWFATAESRADGLSRAASRLTQAMIAYPDLVAGEGRACTGLMRAAGGRAALKTGAEGVFIAILPDQGLGVAVKIADGATRASESAIAAILVRLGVLDARDPEVIRFLNPEITNWAGRVTGRIEPVAELTG
jgi:L-asparaginase II